MTLREAFDTEELLSQLGWMRALAQQVARDPHAAEDLTQDAFLVAWSRRSEEPRSLRLWLAAVVRNLGCTWRRSERRRARRETDVARPEVAPSTLELVERAATHRAVVDELLDLEEPWRSTLLLRFVEGLTARATAAKTGVPESTVATRTAEGLRRLRARLDRSRGGPRAWLPAVLPLLRRPGDARLSAALTGASTMATLTKLTLGAALVVGAFLAYHALEPSGSSVAGRSADVPPRGPHPLQAGADLAAPPATAAPASSADAAARSPQEGQPAPPGAACVPRLTRGRVIDLEGRPVPGILVCRIGLLPPAHGAHGAAEEEAPPCGTSDAAGAFEVEGQPPLRLVARSPLYTTLFQGLVYGERTSEEPTVVVAYRLPLAGIVVDEQGSEVAGALASFSVPGRVLALPGNLLAASARIVPEARSDERGQFAFSDAMDLPDAVLQVSAPGFLPTSVPVPRGGSEYLRVVLRRATPGVGAVAGLVVLADGRPAAGALVSVGRRSARSDEQGVFALEVEHDRAALPRNRPLELVGALAGCLPGFATLPSLAEAELNGWPTDLVLQLGGPAATIRGRVVDAQGQPLRGILVDTVDAAQFGLVPVPGTIYFSMLTREEIAGGEAGLTDGQGRFELAGLSHRSYRIAVLEEPSLLSAVTPPIEAGSTDVRIVLDRSGLGRIAGRVVDREGVGIAGVRVAVSRKRPGSLAIGTSATTDADGRFELLSVSTTPDFLRLEGEPIVPEIFRELPPDADLDALELCVARRCYLQVEWDEWRGRADELRLVGDGDVPLELLDLEGNGVSPRDGVAVRDGLSDVYAIPDSARHALLLRGADEVERLPLQPRAGEFVLLRL